MKARILVLLALVILLVVATVGAAAALAQNTESTNPGASSDHTTVKLVPVGGSGVHGSVDLRQRSAGGTHIEVTARGLKPGHKYVSLYYDNHRCNFEPYSRDDIIGGRYTANDNGVGRTADNVDDNLDEINSVSVRVPATFRLLACADVHPS